MGVPWEQIAKVLAGGIGLADQARQLFGNDAAAAEVERLAKHLSGRDAGDIDPDAVREELDRMVDRLTVNDSAADRALAKKFAEQDAIDTGRGKKVTE